MKGPLEWQIATVETIRQETPRVKSFTLSLPRWTAHRPGQHYDLRLTAADGYQAQRSYSIASAPEHEGHVEFTVEKIDDGEVSPYLHDVLVPGDQIEVRGPIGGYFVWETKLGGPLLLIGGGSGVVPLMAMLRHRAAARSSVPARLLFSIRAPDDAIYQEELRELGAARDGLEVLFTYTREHPQGWGGYTRRIDAAMLSEVIRPFKAPQVFICGPTPLVESAANGLVQIGVSAARVKTERFGPREVEGERMTQDIEARPGIERMLDGNAAAGLLYEIFGGEMTAVPAECAHCGNVAEMGALLAFMPEMGVVLRCPGCEQVVLRIVKTTDAIFLDARGAAYLRLPVG